MKNDKKQFATTDSLLVRPGEAHGDAIADAIAPALTDEEKALDGAERYAGLEPSTNARDRVALIHLPGAAEFVIRAMRKFSLGDIGIGWACGTLIATRAMFLRRRHLFESEEAMRGFVMLAQAGVALDNFNGVCDPLVRILCDRGHMLLCGDAYPRRARASLREATLIERISVRCARASNSDEAIAKHLIVLESNLVRRRRENPGARIYRPRLLVARLRKAFDRISNTDRGAAERAFEKYCRELDEASRPRSSRSNSHNDVSSVRR